MRRGDIWLVELDPAIGSEAAKLRPAVIVSNDGMNSAASRSTGGVITVIPLTSNTSRVFDFQALLTPLETGLSLTSKAQAEQVRSVSVRRLARQVGAVRLASMRRVDDALRVHLAL